MNNNIKMNLKNNNMYKTKSILKLAVSLLFIVTTFTACVKDDNFDTPHVECNDAFLENIPAASITSFQNVVANYTGSISDFADMDADAVYFEGYVTSSDLKGNFYKELFIQDAPENPMYAVKLAIDVRGLYTKYPIGTKLLIKLNGLSIDKSHGELTIGENINGLSNIRENVADANIHRTCTNEVIVPIEVTASSQVNNAMLGKYIQLKDAQFDLTVTGLPFVDPNDSYDTARTIVFCSDESTIKLETSSFAAYGDTPLPSKKFDVSGILSRDYGDDNYVLKLSSTADILTNDDARCDPIILDCGTAVAGANTIFSENFEGISDEADLIPLGWTNVNVNGGTHIWIDKTFSGNKYMQLGAYNSNENPLEAWLVTPAINLDGSTDESFTFDVNVGYYRGAALSVYASTDFTGDVQTATWQLIDNVTLPTGPSSGYGTFQSAGDINVSCLDGDVYFAFKYVGEDGGVTTTFQIDNVTVTGN